MDTQRSDNKEIVNSGFQQSTFQSDGDIISANILGKQIITSSIGNEVLLNNKKYEIKKQITRSGEAEVYLVKYEDKEYIFKYYYSQFQPKKEILDKLNGLKHPDIIALIDFGFFQDRFYEISEYALGGSLLDIMPVRTINKIKEIVKETIEALNYCHTHGIIHRDIKPENILYRTIDKKDIAIGDFGIASNLKEGEELVRTTLARTNLYAAPELFTNIHGKTTIEKSVDYYSLGITILHLWFGSNPFEDVDEYGIMRLKTEGRVIFPDDIDPDVEKLIKGLITVNPRERWGYEDVKRWLNGEEVKVHYQTIKLDYKPYSFGLIDGEQIIVNNPKDLAEILYKYPEKGEGHLYRNTIARWIEPVDQGLYNDLMDIVEKEFPTNRTAGIIKAIYILDPDRVFRGFDKTKLRTQEEIASFFEKNFDHCVKDLLNPSAAFYLFLEARNYKEKANEYRNYFKITNAEAALNTLIFRLQGADKFIIDDKVIYQPEELLELDKHLKDNAINQLSNINSKLSLWITSFKELQPTIDKWRTLKRFDETTFRYALNQGFELNGNVEFNEQGFRFMLLKKHIDSFFLTDDANSNRDEADYWLKNYCDGSFLKIVENYLLVEKYSDEEFQKMLAYVLSECNNDVQSLYKVIESLLIPIQSKTIDTPQLLSNVVDLIKNNVEISWANKFNNDSDQLKSINILNDYLTFIEKISLRLKTPVIASELTKKLDDKISFYISKNVEQVNDLNTFRSNLEEIVKRLKNINPHLKYLNRYEKENILINAGTKNINEKNILEKRAKTKIVEEKIKEEVSNRKNVARGKYKVNLAVRDVSSIAGGIFATLAVITYIILVFIGFTDGFWDGIGVLILGGILGAIVLAVGTPLSMVAGFILYPFIYLFTYLFGSQKAANSVGWSEHDGKQLQNALQQVDNFFIDKVNDEIFRETTRIMLLNEDQLEKELAIYNTKTVDLLIKEAAIKIIQHKKCSVSILQRELKIDYIRATKIIDQLEKEGIIGSLDEKGISKVLVTDVNELNNKFKQV
jgi:serine/threonine protein kinase